MVDKAGTQSGDYYVLYPWNVSAAGTYSVTAEAPEANGNQVTPTIVIQFVEAIDTVTHTLFIEKDCMKGSALTAEVFEYSIPYYSVRETSGTFQADIYNEAGVRIVDDPYSDLVTYGSSVSDSELWANEATYNNAPVYDDQAQDGVDAEGDGSDYEYKLEAKWVLSGTAVAGEASVVGYCDMRVANTDLVAGSYIFAADEAAGNWSTTNDLDSEGGEVPVLMHALEHAVGIAARRGRGRLVSERDDGAPFSVMSDLSAENARLYDAGHDSNGYWNTRNMDDYAIS